MVSFFKYGSLILLVQACVLRAMEPKSLFLIAAQKYFSHNKILYGKDYIAKSVEELSSDTVPIEIVSRLLDDITHYPFNNGKLVFLDTLLHKDKFESMSYTILDRMTVLADINSDYAPYNYFIDILSREPFNEKIARLLIEKYGLSLPVVAYKLISLNESQQLEKLIKKFPFNINNAIDLDWNTLLHRAILTNKYDCAEILLKNGALPNIRNHHGNSCLDIAFQKDHENVITLLKSYDAETYNCVRLENQQKKIVQCLMQ